MKSLRIYFVSGCTYVLWALVSTIFIFPCLLFTLLPAPKRYDNRVYFWLTKWWSMLLVHATFAHVRRTGGSLPLYPNQPAIIVANHTSSLDIPLIDALVGSYPHVWMSKEEYGKVPLWGMLLKRMHVLVPRGKPRGAAAALAKAAEMARGGARHVIMFPEGTRMSDGNIGQFHEGCAMLALKLSRPIIPVYISGVQKVMANKALLLDSRAAPITLHIGEPMFAEVHDDRHTLTKKLRDWFIKISA